MKELKFKAEPKTTDNDLEISGYAVTFDKVLNDYAIFSNDTNFIFGNDGRPVDVYHNHNATNVFASTNNGTLSFEKVKDGIKLKIKFSEDDRYWYNKIKQKLIWGFSIGGLATEKEYIEELDAYHMNEFLIKEVSFTSQPADKEAMAFKNQKVNKQEKVKNFKLKMF